ncbi:hypothetical protein V5O48_015259 [Marasmius crinis-equi]|uniref:F-box domain-containing protein n=1 Tax=Marasmius crinis-equi TaxID=585013 RepID=A0ABR3EV06_9AGAR
MASDDTTVGRPLLSLAPTNLKANSLPNLLTAILRSLHIPSEAESIHLRALISHEEGVLQVIERKVLSLRAELEDKRDWKLDSERNLSICKALSVLDAQRLLLDQRVKQLRQLNSALRRMPIELWERIISFNCQCDISPRYSLVVRNPAQSVCPYHGRLPLYPLCHASHLWRTLSVQVPIFWSHYNIDLDHFPSNMLSLLDIHIQNSQGTPLDVQLSRTRSNSDPAPISGVSAFKHLLPHLSRYRRLALDSKCLKSVLDATEGGRWSFENLTAVSLELEAGTYGLGAYTSSFWEAIAAAPNLTSVTANVLLPRQYISYPGLTTLTLLRKLSDSESRTLLQILPFCTSLTSLTFGISAPLQPVEGTKPVTKLHSLDQLSISLTRFPSDVASLFTAFWFPSLRSLVLTLGPDNRVASSSTSDTAAINAQLSLFKKSSPSITHLTVRFQNSGYCTDRVLSILPLLQALLTLTHLTIVVPANDRERDQRLDLTRSRVEPLAHPTMRLLSHFTISTGHTASTSEPLCPRLKDLRVVDEGFPVFQAVRTVDSLVKIVDSRHRSALTPGLRSFTMVYGGLSQHEGDVVVQDYMDRLKEETLDRIKALKGVGVTFAMETTQPATPTEGRARRARGFRGASPAPDMAVTVRFGV